MTDLKQTLLDIASAIVDTPQEVAVISEDNGDTVNLTLSVAPDDMGMVIGRPQDEALRLCELFQKMVRGEATEDEIDQLEEAGALRDVAHMPARVKCAMLGWRTLNEALRSNHDKPNS